MPQSFHTPMLTADVLGRQAIRPGPWLLLPAFCGTLSSPRQQWQELRPSGRCLGLNLMDGLASFSGEWALTHVGLCDSFLVLKCFMRLQAYIYIWIYESLLVSHNFILRWLFLKIYFICLSVLSTCMSVYHAHAWCPWILEDGIGSLDTGVRACFEPP